MLPGDAPVVVTARVTNLADAPVSLFVVARTDWAAPLSRKVVWTAQRPGSKAFATLASEDAHPLGILTAGESTDVSFTLELPASLGNEYQGQSAPVTLFARAIQQSS